jgi:hypothetical protein
MNCYLNLLDQMAKSTKSTRPHSTSRTKLKMARSSKQLPNAPKRSLSSGSPKIAAPHKSKAY